MEVGTPRGPDLWKECLGFLQPLGLEPRKSSTTGLDVSPNNAAEDQHALIGRHRSLQETRIDGVRRGRIVRAECCIRQRKAGSKPRLRSRSVCFRRLSRLLGQLRDQLRSLRVPILPICTHDPVPAQVMAALGHGRSLK